MIKKILKSFIPQPLKNKIKAYLKRHLGANDMHAVYGKIYTPPYNMGTALNGIPPDIYNSDGEKMELFFLRDIHGAHLVYSDSKYFQWDRYNFGLDTHFYTHNSMLETMGNPSRRYGILAEAESIVPDDYKIFEKHKGLEKDFDLIFTYSDSILQSIQNARYIPFCSKPWYGTNVLMTQISSVPPPPPVSLALGYQQKSKNVSIIASGKTMNSFHIFRNTIAQKCKAEHLADTYGTFDGGRYCDIAEPFKNYRFSIVIENGITPWGFTEKISNCFAAMAIPVYYGATEIDKLFNPDGIIHFNMNDDIEEVLKQCTEENYNNRIQAVIDNFNRINTRLSTDDMVYKKYVRSDIGKISPPEFWRNL